MCDNCREILGSCVRKHLIKDCALKKTSYCTSCAAYGHTFNNCVNKVYDVEYLEQLIPPCILAENQINTNTTILNNKTTNYIELLNIIASKTDTYKVIKYDITPMKPTIDVLDNPKAIRDLLKAYGQMPKKDNRNKDKYKVYLEKFGKKAGYNIVYHLEKKDSDMLDYEVRCSSV